MSFFSAAARVLADVQAERRRQTDRWGVQHHADYRWLSILTEEVGEVAKAINDEEDIAALRAELVQVAAVAVAWVEDIDYVEALSA